jgi:hypothetical protein
VYKTQITIFTHVDPENWTLPDFGDAVLDGNALVTDITITEEDIVDSVPPSAMPKDDT